MPQNLTFSNLILEFQASSLHNLILPNGYLLFELYFETLNSFFMLKIWKFWKPK